MKDLFKFTLNNQLFAAEGGTGAEGDNGEGNNPEGKPNDPNETEKPNKPATFTQADIDRAVSKALTTREQALNQSADERVNAAVQAALEEERRLAQLSEEERKEEARIAAENELAERQRQLDEKILRVDVGQELVGRGLDQNLIDFVIDSDLDTSVNRIDTLVKLIDKQVEAGIKAAVTKPGVPARPKGQTLTKEEIMKISDRAERQQAISDNIHLFE